MSNAWLDIPLGDYEGHMGSASVQQLAVLSELFRYALESFRPHSVAILGVAGGNGLEHVHSSVTKRVVAIDINQHYLDQVQKRFHALEGLELHCVNLSEQELHLPYVDLVHAALIFEHAGISRALDNALYLVAPSGTLSVVLQLPSETEQAVAPTSYPSMQRVKNDFAFVNRGEFEHLLAQKGFQLIEQERRPLPGGKAFWFGTFIRSQGE